MTVTLLAFLVVLLVGLAAYTRVETAVAGNTQRQAQARQNALLALNVALGQLQKYAGPDQRVSATAAGVPGVNSQKIHYTGVWDATNTDTSPLAWLVSGIENGTAEDVTKGIATVNQVALVGPKTDGTPLLTNGNPGSNNTVATLQNIRTVGLPGATSSTPVTIGRYAWWVGDQGVKAPVALADNSGAVNYPPYVTTSINPDGTTSTASDLQSRIRQQISLGAGAADATTGNPVFEPRDTNNASLVANQKVATFNQLAFLKNSGDTALGLKLLQQNPPQYFHAWSPNNFAVLANTRLGGLRQDLSLFSPSTPSPLGAAYDAWANYDPANGGYMEDPANPISPAPLTAYGADPLRRRYVMQPANSAYGIAPVLSFFGLSVSIRNNDNSATPTNLEVSVRCVAELWNPYSSALVPDVGGLQINVSGLPTVQPADTLGTPYAPLDLQAVMGGSSFNFSLPWTPDSTSDDQSSWLPGRVYAWSALSNTADPGGAGNPMQFYLRDSTPPGGSGVVRNAGPPLGRDTQVNGQPNFRQYTVSSSTTLVVELRRASDGKTLARFFSPPFNQFQTDFTSRSTGNNASDFAFIFRMPDTAEIPLGESATWLQAAGRDPRETTFPTNGYVVARGQPPQPELLVTPAQEGFPTAFPDLLLDRDPTTGSSYNEDVPLFELPRAPLLSVGMLQHLRIPGARPFAVGNSWTSGVQLNGIRVDELFDRFYFSGLANGVTPKTVNGSLLLPNPLLKVLRNSATGVATIVTDLQGAPNAQSAKFLLQGGAFNLNSVNPAAWAAVLRGVRFNTGYDFNYLNVSATSGTADDASVTAAGLTDAAFLRFSQSAQEVYKADDNYAQSQAGGGGPVINTPLYRRGVRTLSPSDVSKLAAAIVALMAQHQAINGPFRHIEEFLNPASAGNPSLLEQAISDAGINASIPEFSSQFLTQGDIMTALAPVLFPRSDTFVIRTYGEALNPTTSTAAAPVVEGRAWCEAIVQRVPDYFDASATTGDAAEVAPSALTNPINQTLGRRFKIVSFRWLTRSDI